MSTAATFMTETLIPNAKAATGGVAASGDVAGQAQFSSSFASLLASGNFVQMPGMVPVESEGAPNLAVLLSLGEFGMAVEGEDVQADPLFNVIPLFDSTALSTPAPANAVAGLGLAAATQSTVDALNLGTSINNPIAAPTSGDALVPTPALNPVPVPSMTSSPAPASTSTPVPATAGGIRQTTPVQTNGGQTELAQALNGNPDPDHPLNPQPVLKGVTAADLVAEIAQLDPTSMAAPTATPNGQQEAVPAQAMTSQAMTTQAAGIQAEATSPTAPTAPSQAATPMTNGQPLPEGEATRIASPTAQTNAAQSSITQQSPQARVTMARAVAKPTTGLSSALSGDVALAAMAIDSPRPVVNRPANRSVPNAGQGVSQTVAGQSVAANETMPSFPSATQQPAHSSNGTQSLNGQINAPTTNPGSTFGAAADGIPGQALEQAALGGDAGRPMAETTDQQTAPRSAFDARVESLQAAPQALRTGEAAASPERPTALPTPATAPPAEQVAMQLRNAAVKGADRITVQLSPASLGAVEVTLEVSPNSRVIVHVVAERADTLDMLRADSRALDRALQEAGLRTEQGSLNFILRGDGNNNSSQQNASAFNQFNENGMDGGAESDGEHDPEADDSSPDTPQHQASSQALDIEV